MRFLILGLTTLVLSTHAYAADTATGNVTLIDPLVKESTLMGKPLKVEQQAATVPSGLGVVTTTQAQILGHTGTLIEASVEAIPTDSGSAGTGDAAASPTPSGIQLGRTDIYVGGTRIWTGALRYDKGSLIYSGGVAPTQIPFPIFAYPVGPLMLQVDAGIEFEGQIDASLTPGLSYPLTDSSIDAKLQAELGASGFIEGYASLWLIRGGVGGAVDLVEGATGVTGHLYLNGTTKPTGEGFGKVTLLSGDVYAFVDTKFIFGKWSRILKKDFFKWNGWCYSFGADTCGIQ